MATYWSTIYSHSKRTNFLLPCELTRSREPSGFLTCLGPRRTVPAGVGFLSVDLQDTGVVDTPEEHGGFL